MTDHRLSRRDFITTAMTAAAAAGTLASAVAQDVNEQTIDKRVRIGVVGGGFGAGFHWHED
ncbi:MAG TPA: twin-arginine translocation signal domain-containing protein, partial [Armatimonadota bacterium]|nr:twin-arginine translocation signal domain-containing protein [Armatimonadota bacterium]